MLVASCGLYWLLIMTPATPPLLGKGGLKWGVGNRDQVPERPAWIQRSERALNNMQENLIIFAALVLVVHVAGKASPTSALGAEIFFGARLAHAVIYIAGIPVLRTISWTISLVGMGMLVAALF